MNIEIYSSSDIPIYQQIADAVATDILNDRMSAGHRLPTVRELADKLGVSRGTVKHAYDRLGQMGLIEMTQGRGTFVCQQKKGDISGTKDHAMSAIDELLTTMRGLGFSAHEIRIFVDLKLREIEDQMDNVRVGIVDCNPEALNVIHRQLASFFGVEIRDYLLDDALRFPDRLRGELDLIVTTATHFAEMEQKMAGGRCMQVVLTTSSDTVLSIARLRRGAKVGVISASKRFSEIILRGLDKFAELSEAPEVYFLGTAADLKAFLKNKDVLVAPPEYHRYSTAAESMTLTKFLENGKELLAFNYQIDKGSLLYIEEQIKKIQANLRGAIIR